MYLHKIPIDKADELFQAFVKIYGLDVIETPDSIKIMPSSASKPLSEVMGGCNGTETFLNLEILQSLTSAQDCWFYEKFVISTEKITINGLSIDSFIEMLSESGNRNIIVNHSYCNRDFISAVLPIPLSMEKGFEILKSAAEPHRIDVLDTGMFIAVKIYCDNIGDL